MYMIPCLCKQALKELAPLKIEGINCTSPECVMKREFNGDFRDYFKLKENFDHFTNN